MARHDAPWTEAEVANLKAWQSAPHVHPFTCSGEGPCPARELTPGADGWICACGRYRQAWAHDFMTKSGPPPDRFAHLRNTTAPADPALIRTEDIISENAMRDLFGVDADEPLGPGPHGTCAGEWRAEGVGPRRWRFYQHPDWDEVEVAHG